MVDKRGPPFLGRRPTAGPLTTRQDRTETPPLGRQRIRSVEPREQPDVILVAASDAHVNTKSTAMFQCDGIDDNDQIQAAIDGLPAGGGKVMLSEGVFVLSAAINISGSGVTLSGQGHASILQMAAGNNVDTITNTASVTDIILDKFAIDGSLGGGTSSLGNGVSIVTATRVVIRDLYVHDTYRTGIEVAIGTDVSICNNLVDSAGRGTNAPDIGFTQSTNIVVANNTCKGGAGTDEGIDCNGATEGLKNSRVTIAGNVIDNTVEDGIDATGPHDTVVIIGNSIFSVPINGINLGAEHHAIGNVIEDCGTGIRLTSGGTVDCLISGNLIRGATARGILLDTNTDRNNIVGNHILNSTDWGIDVVSGDYNVITGNLVMNSDQGSAGRAAVALRGSSSFNTVSGNNLSDDQGTPTQNQGVSEEDTANNNIITGNIVQGNTEAGVAIVGAATRVQNNIGHVTENSATATVLSGQTTIAVTHGLAVTPTVDDISITFNEQGTNDYGRWWVDTITSTQFTLNVSADPGASNLTFGWRAVVL